MSSNLKYDWYQTDSHIIINIFIKKLDPSTTKVIILSKNVNLAATLPDTTKVDFSIALCHEILSEESSFKILSTKVEMKLKKITGLRWDVLEEKVADDKQGKDCKIPPAYTTKRDWNKIEVEIDKEKDKLEGDAALNDLFQKIYGDGSEETKMAMKKSYMESGGTVLSTNWNEVAAKKVEVKPPDGVEYKKWND